MKLRLFLLFCLYLALSGCSTDNPTRQNTFVPLTSIEVTGSYDSMADQSVNQYSAIGHYSGAFVRDITDEVAWSIGDQSIASVSNDTGSQGLVTALLPGETSVTAMYGDISGSAAVIVTDISLAAIEITPQDAELQKNITRQYEALGIFSDSSTQDITILAAWESSDQNAVIIDNTGLATTIAAGITTISAAWQGIEASTSLSVTEAAVSEIPITPVNPTIAQGTTVQYQAEATYSDGSIVDITDMATWMSSDNSVVIVDGGGLAEGIAPGQAEITVTFDIDGSTITATSLVTVTSAVIQSILVTPENSTIQNGEDLQYTATATFSDNSQQDITTSATWLSTDDTVGIISNSSFSRGLFISIGPGTTFVEAFFNGVGDETLLIVE